MPTTGLVLTLTPDATDREELLARLGADPRLEVGPAFGPRLALVVESPDTATDRDIFCALQAEPAVTSVDLAFMDFSDVERIPSRELRRMGPRRGAGTPASDSHRPR